MLACALACPVCSGMSRQLLQEQQRKVLGGLSKAVMHSTNSVGRGLSSGSGGVADTVKQVSKGHNTLPSHFHWVCSCLAAC